MRALKGEGKGRKKRSGQTRQVFEIAWNVWRNFAHLGARRAPIVQTYLSTVHYGSSTLALVVAGRLNSATLRHGSRGDLGPRDAIASALAPHVVAVLAANSWLSKIIYTCIHMSFVRLSIDTFE